MQFCIKAEQTKKSRELLLAGKGDDYLKLSVNQAKEYLIRCGVTVENAEKIYAHLVGSIGSRLQAPAEFWMTCINRYAFGQPEDPADGEDFGEIKGAINRITGHIVLPYGKIEMDNEIGRQLLFAFFTKKRQGLNSDGEVGIMNNISILSFDTIRGCAYPLGLLVDANVNNGVMNPSYSLNVYRPVKQVKVGNETRRERQDRLINLKGISGLPQYALEALVATGAPVFETARDVTRNGGGYVSNQLGSQKSTADDENLVLAGDQFS